MNLFTQKSDQYFFKPTTTHKNNETNDKFYRKVVFLMYTGNG